MSNVRRIYKKNYSLGIKLSNTVYNQLLERDANLLEIAQLEIPHIYTFLKNFSFENFTNYDQKSTNQLKKHINDSFGLIPIGLHNMFFNDTNIMLSYFNEILKTNSVDGKKKIYIEYKEKLDSNFNINEYKKLFLYIFIILIVIILLILYLDLKL